MFLPPLLHSVDHSRVKLGLKTSNQDADYINANFIKVKPDSNALEMIYDEAFCVECFDIAQRL